MPTLPVPSLFKVRRSPETVRSDGPLSFGYRLPIRNASPQHTRLLYKYFASPAGKAVITRDRDGAALTPQAYMTYLRRKHCRRAHGLRAETYTVASPVSLECLHGRKLPTSIDPTNIDRVSATRELLGTRIEEAMVDYLVSQSHKEIKKVMFQDVRDMCPMARMVEDVVSVGTEGLYEYLQDGDLYRQNQWTHQAPQLAIRAVTPVKRSFVEPLTQERYREMLQRATAPMKEEDLLLMRTKFFRDVVMHPHFQRKGYGFTYHKTKGQPRALVDMPLVPLAYDVDTILASDPDYGDLLKDDEMHEYYTVFFRCHTHKVRDSFTDIRKTHRVDEKTGLVTVCEVTPQRDRVYYTYSPKSGTLSTNKLRRSDPLRGPDARLGRFKMITRRPGEVPGKPGVIVFLKRLV